MEQMDIKQLTESTNRWKHQTSSSRYDRKEMSIIFKPAIEKARELFQFNPRLKAIFDMAARMDEGY